MSPAIELNSGASPVTGGSWDSYMGLYVPPYLATPEIRSK